MGKLTLFEVAILLIFLQMAIQSGMSYPNIQENEPNNIHTQIDREDARGVAGVAAATPKFQVLLYKMVLKISKNFLYTMPATPISNS